MKKACFLILICITVSVCFAAFPRPSANSARLNTSAQQAATALPNLKSLSVKDVEQQAGRKLGFSEKVSFWLIKKHLMKAEGGTRGTAGSAVGGFFLGLILGPIGVLVAYLLPKNRTLRLWSWIGFGVLVVISIFLLSLAAAFSWN